MKKTFDVRVSKAKPSNHARSFEFLPAILSEFKNATSPLGGLNAHTDNGISASSLVLLKIDIWCRRLRETFDTLESLDTTVPNLVNWVTGCGQQVQLVKLIDHPHLYFRRCLTT